MIFSGVLMSHKAIPTLTGARAAPQMDWHWDYFHTGFSQLVLMLSGLHLAIDWEWVLAAGQRIFHRVLAGGLVWLTGIYRGSAQFPLLGPEWQEERQHRRSEPQISEFPLFVGDVAVVALYAVAGRLILRLRLPPVSPGEKQMISLRLCPGATVQSGPE